MTKPPHLLKTHPQFKSGFPARVDDALLGHWQAEDGMVVVEHHPHGYELHFYPCYNLETCEACSANQGTSNPHTGDGHDFRECPNRGGPILTVAGGEVGQRAVLQYLSEAGSPVHRQEWGQLLADEAEAEREFRQREREEHERQMAEQESVKPSAEERLTALEAEIAALRAEQRGT